MTIREALSDGASALSATGSDTPFLDASLLLSRAAGLSRSVLLARGADPLPEEIARAFRSLLDRRANGECVAYILGEKEFFGRVFRVDPRVLVPRPDTETLVEAVSAVIGRRFPVYGRNPRDPRPYAGLRLHDAFTGSGCVGITLAAELPGIEVSLSDASRDALDVAAENAGILLGSPLSLFLSDVLANVPGEFDAISANPPYVESRETDRIEALAPNLSAASREPRSALDGGPDGLQFYRRLVPEAEKKLAQGGVLAVEIGEDQGPAVADLLRSGGYADVEILPDLAGRDRVVLGLRR